VYSQHALPHAYQYVTAKKNVPLVVVAKNYASST